MDRNYYRYLWVGIFIIVSTTLLVSIWLWLSQGNRREYNTYVSIFHEPIDGITLNSTIKYNGVEVGKVKQIELDRTNPRNISVYLDILKEVSVRANTFATIKSQGITGLSYIDLRLPSEVGKNETNLEPHNTLPYPEIPTKASLFYSLSEEAGAVGANMHEISSQAKALLNQKNIDHVSSILDNLDKVSTTVVAHSGELGRSIDALSKTLLSTKNNTENLTEIVNNIADLTESLAKTTGRINAMIENLEGNTLQNFNAVLLPTVNQTVNNINDSATQLKYLLQTVNQNPSILIRGKNLKPGPGEDKENK